MKTSGFSLLILLAIVQVSLAQQPVETVLPPSSCVSANCHPNATHEIEVSVHGTVVEMTCLSCHLDHGAENSALANQPIERGNDIRTCGECHAKERDIFFSTYHGKHFALGKVNNPTCVHCHAGHELPQANPSSPIHPQNVGRICAGCHGGSSEEGKQKMAATLASVATGHTLYRKDEVIPFIIKGGYSLLTLVFLVFAWLCGVELVRKPHPTRPNHHGPFHLPTGILLQTIAFVLIYLALDGSGITLLYAHEHGDVISKGMSTISQHNMRLFHSPDVRSLVHRLAGFTLGLLFLIHLIYLWRNQTFLRRIRWNRDDTRAFFAELRFQPHSGSRWKQKGTYWAILCLGVIMLVTGITQWAAFGLMKHVSFRIVRFADIIHEWNGRLLTMWIYGILIGYFGIVRPLFSRWRHARTHLAAGVLLMLLLGTHASAEESTFTSATAFTSATQCQSCHPKIYEEWKQSFHAQSISTPTFKAMLTIFNYNTGGQHLDYCFKCHAAEVKVARDPVAASEKLARQVLAGEPIQSEGITCTVCHSIERVRDEPNSDVPVSFEVGLPPPFHQIQKTPLFKQQDLCGSCHDYNNPNFPHPEQPSTPCCDVNRDWKETSFAQKGITCQSCHMEETMGVAKRGKAEKLQDTLLSLTGLRRYRDDRGSVSHLFPGGRSAEMLKKAVTMRIASERAGNEIQATVLIQNLIGHSIPNG